MEELRIKISSSKIVGRVPILAAPNPKEIDELTPFGRKLMYVLNKKNYKKYAHHAHELDIGHKSTNKGNQANITLSPFLSTDDKEKEEKWAHLDVTVGVKKRNKRKIISTEENMKRIVNRQVHSVQQNFKTERIVKSELEDFHKKIIGEPHKIKKLHKHLPEKQQKDDNTNQLHEYKNEDILVNQFEKCLNICNGEMNNRSRIFKKKIRIEEFPINYYTQESMYDEIEKKRKKLSIECIKDENQTKYLTVEKYKHIKNWCNSQPFDDLIEVGFEEINLNENEEILSSSSEELNDFTRLITKKPKIKILDIKYLKEHEKLKIQRDVIKRDPVIFLDKISNRIVKTDPKRHEIQSKISSILKCKNEKKQIFSNNNLVVQKNYKQKKISDFLKKR